MMTNEEKIAWLRGRGCAVADNFYANGIAKNGCGPACWKSKAVNCLMNHFGGGVDLTPCGDWHDDLYGVGGGEADRRFADREFRRLILSWLSDVPWWRFILRGRVRLAADAYYVAVREFGNRHFNYAPGTSHADNREILRAVPVDSRITRFTARATCYYPDPSPLEGGFQDRCCRPLQTTQNWINGTHNEAAGYGVDRNGGRIITGLKALPGRCNAISVAMDPKTFPYGTRLRCPELDDRFGHEFVFAVVDTGGAFYGKGTGRIDICTADRGKSFGMVTLEEDGVTGRVARWLKSRMDRSYDARLNKRLDFYAVL